MEPSRTQYDKNNDILENSKKEKDTNHENIL